MRKAFIAAPLIGAIVFLTAIVFVVNINKAEASAVQQTSQEAYHNRISSVVELYRADAGSLFRESMKTVIEDALTSQCWSSLFTVKVDVNGRGSEADKLAAVKESRKKTCENIKKTVHTIVCSNTGEAADARQNEQCANNCEGDPDQRGCLARCGAGRSYGLQRWLGILNQEFSFEGIELSPSNQQSFEQFFKPTDRGEFDWTKYIGNCKALIPELAIDCPAFAEGDLQCCKVDTTNNRCPADKVIQGCESGIFFVKITPGSDQVYASLPRVQAKDDSGNYIRAGALSDAREFFLPISFPLFRYLDKSFAVYNHLAFGKNVGSREDASDVEGILDGACYASAEKCSAIENLPMPSAGIITASQDSAKQQLSDRFYQTIFLDALNKELVGSNLDVQFLAGGGVQNAGGCTERGGVYSCDVAGEGGGVGAGGVAGAGDGESYFKDTILRRNIDLIPSGGQFSPYLRDLLFTVNFVDKDPRFRVKPNADNKFCWVASLQYKAT